jgi:heme/copper-type cytochrome/quinol oxidase subunit 4
VVNDRGITAAALVTSSEEIRTLNVATTTVHFTIPITKLLKRLNLEAHCFNILHYYQFLINLEVSFQTHRDTERLANNIVVLFVLLVAVCLFVSSFVSLKKISL